MQQDLTRGSITGGMLRFALPHDRWAISSSRCTIWPTP